MHVVVQTAKPRTQVLAHARVERPERLVEEEDARLDREGTGEGHPLPLAARELGRVALAEPVQLHEPEQLVHALPDLLLRLAGRIESPKPMLSRTVMCLKAA